MQSLMAIVGGVEVTAEHSLEIWTHQRLDHLVPARVMIFVVAHCRRTHTPNVAVDAIFPPARLIGLHGRTGSDGCFERRKRGLHLLCQPMQ
jgi:hypothetical protein